MALQLITAAQNFTGSFVDLGSPVKMARRSRCGLWLNVDINDTLNPRVRALAQLEGTGGATAEYVLPIKVVGASDVKLEDEVFEFNVDADQLMVLEIVTNFLVPFIQFQIQAGTVGASAGQIDSANVTFKEY